MYPTVVMRNPYVDAEENLSEEEICKNRVNEFGNWLDSGYAVVFQHCREGEKLRIVISSSAFPLYVRHTNNKGLFSEQSTAGFAVNTVDLKNSYLEIPIEK